MILVNFDHNITSVKIKVIGNLIEIKEIIISTSLLTFIIFNTFLSIEVFNIFF